MDNIVSVKLDSRYASTLGVWQYDYGQVLRITGPELPPAVEVQFSLDAYLESNFTDTILSILLLLCHKFFHSGIDEDLFHLIL